MSGDLSPCMSVLQGGLSPAALGELMRTRIHALSIEAQTPAEAGGS